MKRVAACIVLISASSAQASNWVKVGSSSSATLYYDTESLRVAGPKVTLWSKFDKTNGERELDHSEIDCAAETIKTLSNDISTSGEVTVFAHPVVLPIAPDTLNDYEEAMVCQPWLLAQHDPFDPARKKRGPHRK